MDGVGFLDRYLCSAL